jgi:type IV pilus assembly protein PilB
MDVNSSPPRHKDTKLKNIKKPYGIILVTGPTGSGKSTTLYSVLNNFDRTTINVSTVEDPVESNIEGVHQAQINSKAGFTFASALRSLLRQDPDVIMVGEIRDSETAQIAVQAALTGHVVLSTLHTNDAFSAPTRLIDMGIESYLVASSLEGIVAQRLVRKICPDCKQKKSMSSEIFKKACLPAPDSTVVIWEGKGCPVCRGTGYRGRTAIFEIMVVTDEIRDLIFRKVTSHTIKEKVLNSGGLSLRQDGLRKVLQGVTTIQEVMRVT